MTAMETKRNMIDGSYWAVAGGTTGLEKAKYGT